MKLSSVSAGGLRSSAAAAVLFLRISLAAVAPPASPSDTQHHLLHYQATAYISLFSVTIFSRSNVGFGYAKADEDLFPQRRNLSLQFLSGSIPDRAHGLNRFGFIQENIEERDDVCTHADYFGLITSNGEESLSQAKAALDNKSQTTPFVAAKAVIDRESARYAIRHMELSSAYRGANAEQLLGQVRASFDHPETGQPEHRQLLSGGPLGTFLYSVRQAMQAEPDKLQKRFIYNGKMFMLLTEKQTDNKVGQELRGAGLVRQASSVTRLNGAIRNEKTNEVTNFRLWFEHGAADLLPLRFEFRPKPYLRLVFQATLTPPSAASSNETGQLN